MTKHKSKTYLRVLRACLVLACPVLAACSASLNGAIDEHGGSFMQRLLATADNLSGKRDYDNALILYKKIIDHASSEDDELYGMAALNGYGETLMALERPQDAVTVFEHSLSQQPYDNGRALFGLAKTYLALGRIEEAIENYLLIVQMWPENPEGYNGLGVAYDSKGFHDEAQKTYRKGLSYAPGDVSLSNNLGVSLILNGRFAEAVHALQPLSFDQKATPKVRQNLAFAYAFLGDMKAAEQISRIDLDPQASQRNLEFFRQLRAKQMAQMVMTRTPARTADSAKDTALPPQEHRQPTSSAMAQNRPPPSTEMSASAPTDASAPPTPPTKRPQQDIFTEPTIIAALDRLAEQERVPSSAPLSAPLPSQKKPQQKSTTEAKNVAKGVLERTPKQQPIAEKQRYTVQVATYSSRSRANSTAERLRREGYAPRVSQEKNKRGRIFHVLRVGSYQKTSDAIKTVEDVYRLLGVLGEIRIKKT
ncbi:MAG: tetratricopeptide repeat protein [Alphaproteobacteria bacterium GM202ARS2]|nr:tetratricopeptide repeat protein [Alphaproteobacteria bacterium GM202ARS2]